MKVVVIGAGISGLTVAHELIEKGFDVEVYEKSSVAGGMARSTRTEKGIPSEHSWRAYAPFYYNAFEIMSRIPIKAKLPDYERPERDIITFKGQQYDLTEFIPKHPGGTIIKRMLKSKKPLEKVWKDNKVAWHMENPYVMSVLEKHKVGSEAPPDVSDNLAQSGIKFKLLTDKREGETKVSFIDYPYLSYLFIKNTIVNKRRQNKTRLIDALWPIQETSKDYLIKFISGPGYGFDKNTISTNHFFCFIFQQFYAGNHSWQVMNQPTSEAWIDPWVKHLKSKGVRFHFDSKMSSLTPGGAIINGELIKADDYVLATPPDIPVPNIQISFRLGFNRKIAFETHNTACVLLDSEYEITFYAQDEHWSKDVDLGPVVSLWSGTITNGDKAAKLKPKELIQEIKRQLLQSKYIKHLISESDIVYAELFEDWHWDSKTQRLVSKNPKWVNEVGEIRPPNFTEYENIWRAGAHTKTSIDVWCTEGAVESGKLASNLILTKYNLKKCLIMDHEIKLGKIDDLFYDLGLPHVLDCFLITLILFLVFFRKYKR